MQQTDFRGIVVNNRITNVLREKINTKCAKRKREKKKSGGFGVMRLIDKLIHSMTEAVSKNGDESHIRTSFTRFSK